jgi:hypothetical protein
MGLNRVREDALDLIGACFGEIVGRDRDAFGSGAIHHDASINPDIELTSYSKSKCGRQQNREGWEAVAAQLAQPVTKRKSK